MKYVFLAIFILFAAQPVQATSCGMCDGHNGTMSGDSMHEDSMHDDHEQPMDCCDQDPAESGDSCDAMSHCGACVVGVVAINASTLSTFFNLESQQFLPPGDEPVSSFSSPPFRPPIS